MPLRDHFHTTSTLLNWEAVHAFWPSAIVTRLNAVLPKEYVAQPRLHVGTLMELDIGALERESPYGSGDGDGGVAVATWAPAVPMILLDTEFPEPSEYEVNVYKQDEFRLVAAIGLVSPSNKDRAENRQTFVNKCESLLKKGCVRHDRRSRHQPHGQPLRRTPGRTPRTANGDLAERDLCRHLPGSAVRIALALGILGTRTRRRGDTADPPHLAGARPHGPLRTGSNLRRHLPGFTDPVAEIIPDQVRA